MLANQRLYCLSYTSSPFCSYYFGDGVSRVICLGWSQIAILLISASQVVRITGMSHRTQLCFCFYSSSYLYLIVVTYLYFIVRYFYLAFFLFSSFSSLLLKLASFFLIPALSFTSLSYYYYLYLY
jgi:hypothetical protein